MDKPIGGRGKSAPYKSTHVRIPEPIKGRVEELKELFFSNRLEQHDNDLTENKYLADKYREELLNRYTLDVYENSHLDKGELIKLAKGVLKQKKSARHSVQKLLTGLLGEEISLEDLTK